MDHSEYSENVPHFGSTPQTINDNNKELSHETPEQRVATNLSQQVLASNLFESQTQPAQEPEIGRHSAPVDVFGQHLSQTIGNPIEQRLSGHQQEYDVYEYEEDDEEEDDLEDSLERRQIESRPNIGSDLMFSSSPNTNQSSTDPFRETGVRPKEEILYQLSDDSNVLRAQSYGIGSGLRIDSQNDQNLGNVYSLNSENPFQTPEKKADQNKNKQLAEEAYDQFMTREEPYETMSTNFGISSDDKTDNLLEFDINSPQFAANVKPISHSIGLIESNRNHSQSSGESEDEVIVTSSGQVSKLPTHTFAERVSLSPNLDETQTVDTLTDTALSQHSVKQSSLLQDERNKTIDLNPRDTSKQDKGFEEKKNIMANKKDLQESSSNADNSTTGCGCPFGPSLWLNPKQLNPTVAELVYWRNPKKTGIVFGSGLVILLSLTFFSIISVVAYASLAALSVTLSFRIYKNILQAVQKTNEGHPFKEYLEVEITPSNERIHQIADSMLTHFNCTINKLRSVFLVEDIIDSLKFVVLFWCLTYIGSWFNGLTLIILAYLAVFSLPKVYEMNKTQIDHYLNLACTQIHEITSKVRAKIPFPAKKEKDN